MIDSTRVRATEVASHYDDLDPFYRRVWGTHLHHGYFRRGSESVPEATRALVDRMLAHVRLGPSSKVIDVGCGYGDTARLIAARFGAEVLGLTISARQHALARADGAANPKFRLADWMENDLPDACADFVYSIESSEHMPDFNRFFAEAARVLRPGGRLATYAWLEGRHRGGWRKTHLLQALCDEGRMRLATADEYRRHCAENGLRLVAHEDLSNRVARTWTICLRRALKLLVVDREFRAYAFSRASRNRDFALALPRIRLAFATGAMHYGLFIAEKI